MRREPALARRTAGGVAGVPVALAAASHGPAETIIISAIVVVLITVIVVAVPELFWLSALRQSSRDLRWLISNTTTVTDTERLGRLLQSSSKAVLDARARSRGGAVTAGPPDSRTE